MTKTLHILYFQPESDFWEVNKHYISISIMKRLFHLCMWTCAQVLKPLKRRFILILLCICSIVLVLLMKWGFMCTNIQPLLHIQYVCASYENGQSIGNMCKELCQQGGISSLSCHKFYMGKDTVFSGSWKNTSVVFKLPKKISNDVQNLYWLDVNAKKIYPSRDDFSKMIKTTIKIKFNISINDIDAMKMSYIQFSQIEQGKIEMENVWSLIQDNEYLALSLYEKFDIFPKLIGSCGSMYAVQKLDSISGFWHLMTLFDSQEEWEKRIKISLKILDFLLRLDNDLPEPLHICDMKMNHFGISSDMKRIKYLDLDSVHPVSIANRITADGSRCKQHSDCDFFDCRSFCNLVTFRCQHGIVNNNLQIVCERIFLGWVMSGKIMVPGLLLGPRTPRVLIEVLEQCANPVNELDTPRAPATEEIRRRLYNLLTHLILS